jgi:DNA-binding LacI/PurR family transcriptional regulator
MGATMSDIAAKAGTSVAAVSVALNGAKSKTLRVSEDTRLRILQAAEELGYRRNALAGALATGRSMVLGLMLPNMVAYTEHDPFFSLVTTGVNACAAVHSYNVMLYAAAAEDEGARAAKMIDRRIDGLILVNPPTDTPIYAEAAAYNIPVVSIICRPDENEYTVNSDDYNGGSLATRHLLDLGHRRIAHLVGNPTVVTSEPRLHGYLDALKSGGVAADPHLSLDGGFSKAKGYESTARLLKLPKYRRPTAIFAANDLSAHGALDAIHEAGLQVPQDISVVGYDDTWYATVTRPQLTSVKMHVHDLGREAANMLVAHLDGATVAKKHRVLPVSLTVRESSGPAPK